MKKQQVKECYDSFDIIRDKDEDIKSQILSYLQNLHSSDRNEFLSDMKDKLFLERNKAFINSTKINKRGQSFILAEEQIELIFDNIISFINSQLNSKHIARKYTVQWKGKNKELAELFIELQNQGWINSPQEGDIQKFVDCIINCFSDKNNSDFNTTSLYTIMKGEINDDDLRDYPLVHTKRYKRKFTGILPNSN